jgi:hypothetical protein
MSWLLLPSAWPVAIDPWRAGGTFTHKRGIQTGDDAWAPSFGHGNLLVLWLLVAPRSVCVKNDTAMRSDDKLFDLRSRPALASLALSWRHRLMGERLLPCRPSVFPRKDLDLIDLLVLVSCVCTICCRRGCSRI